MKDNFRNRLVKAMSLRNIKASELSKKTGLSKAQISQYTNGIYEAKQKALYSLAVALDVSEAWLMGYDVQIDRELSAENEHQYVFPYKTKRVPLLGDIACGEPIYADEQHGEFVDMADNLDVDFCLRAKGDSMINARINDGDIVFIHKQDIVDNGKIAAVIINDEATLKRVYYYPDESKLILTPENPAYAPLVYVGEELNSIKILGMAVAFQSII